MRFYRVKKALQKRRERKEREALSNPEIKDKIERIFKGERE